MSLRTVLFDLDGTLIDSIELILRSFEHTWEITGREPLSRAEWLTGVGRPLVSHFADYVDDRGEVEELIRIYRAYNLEAHDGLVDAFPGMVETITRMASAGATMGIVTSKAEAPARRGLLVSGFEESHFSVVITSDDDVTPKPDPAPLLAALERLGVAPTEAAYVGDSPHDMASAKRAGVLPVAALWGPFEPGLLRRAGAEIFLTRPADVAGLVEHSEFS